MLYLEKPSSLQIHLLEFCRNHPAVPVEKAKAIVCFNVPPRYIESQFETEIITESEQNGERGAQGCKYLFCNRLD